MTGQIANGIEVAGDGAVVEQFMELFDTVRPNAVNLVLPRVNL